MKLTIDNLKDSFQVGYETYQESRDKANLIEDMFHNRQYTPEQEAYIREIGQPPETFNIIKLFTRQLIGYYSNVINTIRVAPVRKEDLQIAQIFNDVIKYIDYKNNFKQLADTIKMDGFLSGLFCAYTFIRSTNKKDEFGRPIYEVIKEHVPSYELVLDPMSRKLDYSDARFIHRFKWLPKETVKKLFPYTWTKLEPYDNHLDIKEAEFEFTFNNKFDGRYNQLDNYLIVHTIWHDDKGRTWSVYWSGDHILSKTDISYSKVKSPYTVTKLIQSSKAEYYGVFNDVYESQNAINQALLQIQFLVNTNRVLVQENAVEDFEQFKKAFNRVNAIVKVLDINGIKLDKLNAEIQQQYIIIDRAFDRIQKVLGINDSFLGMAFASDSGKKVQLQQQASIVGLNYIDDALHTFYRLQGWNTIKLVQQFYRAHQIFSISDEFNSTKFVEINRPLQHPLTGEYFYEEEYDPQTQQPLRDENGNIIVTPLSDPDTDLANLDVELFVESVNTHQEDEKAQLLIETILNGNAGQMLMTVNPAGYAKIAALSVQMTKTKYSPEIAKIFEETAEMLQPQPEYQALLGQATKHPNVEGLTNVQNRTNRVSGEAL